MDLLVGFAFKSAEFTDEPDGIRLLRGDNVGQGRLRWNGPRRWPFERRSEFERYELRTRDIVLAMDRPWIDAGLKYATVRDEDVPCLLVQRVARLRGADTLAQQYLRYLIASPEFTSWVKAVQTGTAVPHISGGQIADYPFPLPPRPEQERIVSVLGVLDDKIDSNRRLARLLEQIAQTEFQARFVDYVGAESLEDSELGPVPGGWHVGVLEELLGIEMGQSPPGASYIEDPDSGLPLVQGMADFRDRYPRVSRFTTEPRKRAESGAVLMTVRAPVGAVNVARQEVCIGRGVAALTSTCPAFAEFLVRSLKPRWAGEESGTIFPAVNRKQIAGLPVVVPSEDAIAEFQRFARPLVDQLAALHDETKSLTSTRDALLPKLISGQIRVPDTTDAGEVVDPLVDAAV